MDPKRFDALAESLARSGSRRRLLGGLLAVVPLTADAKSGHQPEPVKGCLGEGKTCAQPAAATARHGHAKGKHHKGKHRPPSCSKCCSGFGAVGSDGKARCSCKPDGTVCGNPSECCGGLCRNGQCTRCQGDLTACNDDCVDLQTDHDNCSACGAACDVNQRCQNGACICDSRSCPTGCCDGATCRRGASDQACGVNGAECQTCGTCLTCDGATCVAAVNACCDGGQGFCQTGSCVDCAAGQRRQAGFCVCDDASCPDGCCLGATCVPHARQNPNKCGTGGAACDACQDSGSCVDGVCCASGVSCRASGCCPQSTNVCDANDKCCAPATTCPVNVCGTIDDGCGGTIECPACGGGRTCCGGVCTDTNFDNANCGACGHDCTAIAVGGACFSGACCQNAIGNVCLPNLPCCGSDLTCSANGACCVRDGFFCGSGDDCCGGTCTGNFCG